MKEEENIDFNSPMTDLMTSLMVIFILLLVVALNNMGSKGEKTIGKLMQEMKSDIANIENIKITRSENDPLSLLVMVDENTGVKFASNSSKITPQTGEKLEKIFDVILDHTCSPENYQDIDSIQIVGHTDKNAVKTDPKFGNLKLSQSRALSVLQYGLNYVKVDSEKGHCLQELASINGRGMAELLPTDAESRRVEFKIRAKSYEQAEKIKNEFKRLPL